ncbi:Uncharacterised protein [Mycobacterium tuberculosis]|uniref:Uncharacterized protein n=2 Tax=Bacteria TaxID=2 RepID=A0A655AVH3_MYCTX|nr:Uncharacterised protein [Mycobacterium tuberculosis]CFB94400.1 Uncharacterised protein [Mycobacterium tuberculosis]CFE22031.1 Uncharacterised protein [Mycobacterium tuberculosis]CFE80078.1 Uncharacterised protein [Mycobacterium tuberculosis]CFR37538.1 Uncharacterised protein [Mycobacterium tuberculosis]
MNHSSHPGVAAAVNADDRGEVRPSSVLGKWAISSAIALCAAPAEVPAALATADNCVAAADGLVVFGGGANGVTLVAVAEEPA